MSPRKDGIVEPSVIWGSKQVFVGVSRSSTDADGSTVGGDGNCAVVLFLVMSKRGQCNLDCVWKCQHLSRIESQFLGTVDGKSSETTTISA